MRAEPDAVARLAEYRSGAADLVPIRSWDIPELPADQVVLAAPHRLTFVGLNRHRPVADREGQEALAAVLDYPAMADLAEGTMAIPYGADGLTRPAVAAGSAPALDQAELIFDATDRDHRRLAESVEAAVAGLGHVIQVVGLDADVFDERRAAGDYDLILVRTDAQQTSADLPDDAELPASRRPPDPLRPTSLGRGFPSPPDRHLVVRRPDHGDGRDGEPEAEAAER